MSYKNLEIWQLAKVVTIEVHKMTISLLPKYEMYEEGAQIRRSIKSVRSNIVEGYGRRRFKNDFIKYYIDHQKMEIMRGVAKDLPDNSLVYFIKIIDEKWEKEMKGLKPPRKKRKFVTKF